MKKIKETITFKIDFKKYYSDKKIKNILSNLILKLITNERLDNKYKNHQLKSNWYPSYDCHILPNLLLIYQITDTKLKLIRIGSHSEPFK